jgi:hypothetical protein
MAMLYSPDGRTKQVRPTQGGVFTNEELWELVGGYYEVTRTLDGEKMLIHDEGKLLGLDLNIPATRIYVYGRRDVIVGNALVLEPGEIE